MQLAVGPEGRVRYAIRYRRWAAYALAMGAAFALVFGAFLFLFDIRSYIEHNAASRVPGLSTTQNLAIAWAMAVFWGFVFPWIGIALHKGPLRRLMGRLITEVDAAAKKERG